LGSKGNTFRRVRRRLGEKDMQTPGLTAVFSAGGSKSLLCFWNP
jgi:hypothetical protein